MLHLKFLSIVLTSYKYWQNNITVFNHFLTKIQAIDCAYEGSVWWVLSRGKPRAGLQATQDSHCSAGPCVDSIAFMNSVFVASLVDFDII